MSTRRVYTDYLQDIVDYAEKAMRFVEDVSFDDFGDNEEKIFAVVKTLEIIGEAARHLQVYARQVHVGSLEAGYGDA